MSNAAMISATFEDVDKAKIDPQNGDALDLTSRFLQAADQLAQWERTEFPVYHSPLWWPVTTAGGETYLWFQDLAVANCTTYFWAFRIICLTNIRQLRIEFPSLLLLDIDIDGKSPESIEVTQEIIQLSNQIIQSMEFLTQEEMGVYGVASAALPLQIAFGVLSDMGSDSEAGSKPYLKTIKKIIDKGYKECLLYGIPTEEVK